MFGRIHLSSAHLQPADRSGFDRLAPSRRKRFDPSSPLGLRRLFPGALLVWECIFGVNPRRFDVLAEFLFGDGFGERQTPKRDSLPSAISVRNVNPKTPISWLHRCSTVCCAETHFRF